MDYDLDKSEGTEEAVMNIGSISTNISTSDIKNDVQVAMLKKSLDTIETSGNDMIKMMESSVTPGVGQNIDIRV